MLLTMYPYYVPLHWTINNDTIIDMFLFNCYANFEVKAGRYITVAAPPELAVQYNKQAIDILLIDLGTKY